MRRVAEFAVAAVGGAVACVLSALTDFTPLKTAALWPGFAFGPTVARYLPETLAYALAPSGGPAAMIIIILVVSFAFWAVATGAAWLAVSHFWRRGSRSARPGLPPLAAIRAQPLGASPRARRQG